MFNQEGEFAARQEQQTYYTQPINTDPREQFTQQTQWQVPLQEGEYQRQGTETRHAKIRPSRPRRRGSLIFLGVALVLLLVIGSGIAYASYAFSNTPGTTQTHAFTVTAHPILKMNVDSGSIHLHTSNTLNVVVKEIVHTAGPSVSNMHVTYTQDGNTMSVNEQDSGISIGFTTTDFDVTVPTTIDLQLQTGSGSVAISNIKGLVSAGTGSGSISVSNISGQQVTLKSGSGSITAQGLNGEVTLDTGSGSLTVTHGALSGNSLLKTGSSSINYEGSLASAGQYRFETGSGDVNLILPASSAFHLSTNSGSGDVNNQFGNDTVGTHPQAQLSIKTGSGDIAINKGS